MSAVVVARQPRRIAGRAVQAVTRLSPCTILALGWTVVLVYAFPGQMTADSFDHMREARAGIYSDAHPPVIDVLWAACDRVIAGPFGVLLVQTGLLLIGLYAILRRAFAPRGAAWWTAAVLVAPPVMVVMSVIWKDCVMAGLLVVGLAGLLSPRRGRRMAGLVALTLAATARYNALGATLPLVVMVFEWRPGLSALRRYALATVVWLATTFAAFGINAALTDKPMHYWHSSLALYDIVGTYALVDRDLDDDHMKTALAGTDLQVTKDIQATMRALYTPRDFLPILSDARPMWDVPINGYVPAPQVQREAIERAWRRAVSTYPLSYAKHRLLVMGELLDLRSTHSLGAVIRREFRDPPYAAQQGLATAVSPVQTRMTRWVQWLSRHTPLFVPWVYALISLVLLPVAARHRDVLALLLSGLAMEGTLLLLVHAHDYRYSHWMVITTCLGVILLVARRYRAARATAGTGQPPAAAAQPPGGSPTAPAAARTERQVSDLAASAGRGTPSSGRHTQTARSRR